MVRMGMPRLKGKVALVTGASRGGGKGIALVVGEEGATVYVTGRSVRGEPTTLGRPGTIDDTAEELTARGGIGIAVRCDHADDAQVAALFERIRGEQGRLDLLVNNAWSGYEIAPYADLPFWEIEWRHWDLMFRGGLRATAFASTLAAPMMIEAGSGLIVNKRLAGGVFAERGASPKPPTRAAILRRCSSVASSPPWLWRSRPRVAQVAMTTRRTGRPGHTRPRTRRWWPARCAICFRRATTPERQKRSWTSPPTLRSSGSR
jgi:NAD(P)-dependent dehydrogenase (short-subunit alcohol dehydrogenase family)